MGPLTVVEWASICAMIFSWWHARCGDRDPGLRSSESTIAVGLCVILFLADAVASLVGAVVSISSGEWANVAIWIAGPVMMVIAYRAVEIVIDGTRYGMRYSIWSHLPWW